MMQLNTVKTMTSAAQAMYAMLQYTDKKDFSLSEIMGYSSHAFRMNIHPESVSPAGPTMFAPYELVSQNLKTLGVYTLTKSEFTPLSNKDLADTIRMAEARIDTGVPIISWDLFSPEFGLIYGYDHEQQVFYAKDMKKEGIINYSELNERASSHLFLCGFFESVPKRTQIMFRDALKKIIEHGDGKSPFAPYEYRHGLAGYDAWIRAFQTRKIDAFGNAYNMAVVADARKHATHFLTILSEKWEASTKLDQQVIDGLTEAKGFYSKVASYFDQLGKMFPFPQGGEPNDLAISQKAIELLQHAYEWERKGMEVFRRLESLLEQYADDNYMTPYRIKRTFEFAGVKHFAHPDQIESDAEMQMYELMKRDNSIVSRITNIKLFAYKSGQTGDEEKISYVVARPVSFKPYNLPKEMQYFKMEHNYAAIRVKMKEKKQGYETLKNWMLQQGIEENTTTYTIEFIRPPQHRSTEEEVEIYVPIIENSGR
ncbi:GyrI-like domain-containing protein [Evansella sp. LMS18]|uniref:GyrI-like domain-containing protein n=1 Tax=Evansella sp. LMS18 TaxID=2924033 RepID=UPI0020D1EBD3|nr:GyrI-like domain-containing protein [Evansella sp. LMS18]UTR10309.1 GyrI-like domain-containing protein [Evansella sp. LMS18]